jgi:hypothetical protein
MRDIDWDSPLSDEDKTWLRTTGILDIERRIKSNEDKHEAPAEEPDSSGGVEPSDDDYEEWKVPELTAEVENRNKVEGATHVEIVGTGKDGKITKPDLIKGLRLWDLENPDVG